MTTDDVVKDGAVSEGAVSNEPSGDVTPEADPEALQKLADAFEAYGKEREDAGARRVQQIKDKEIAATRRRAEDAERRARLESDRNVGISRGIQGLDDDSRSAIEQEDLKARVGEYERREQEREQEQANKAFWDQFNSNLHRSLEREGINPNDPRIDWGNGAGAPLEISDRFYASITKIRNEDRKKFESEIEQRWEAKFAELKKEMGMWEVDTTIPTNMSADADEKWYLEEWTTGRVPATPENKERAEKVYQRRMKQKG